MDPTTKLISLHEGLRLGVYRCPAGKLTIGFGRNLEDKGIISKKKIHKGSDGTTTEITLLDMSSKELEEYLSEKIYKS